MGGDFVVHIIFQFVLAVVSGVAEGLQAKALEEAVDVPVLEGRGPDEERHLKAGCKGKLRGG